jgi:hypothetical protein
MKEYAFGIKAGWASIDGLLHLPKTNLFGPNFSQHLKSLYSGIFRLSSGISERFKVDQEIYQIWLGKKVPESFPIQVIRPQWQVLALGHEFGKPPFAIMP